MILNLILQHGLIYTGGFFLIIFISILVNPRIWMQDFPEDLKRDIPPKSNREHKQTFVTGFLFSLFIVGFPLYSISSVINKTESHLPFLDLFLHSFSLMMICNILYWLVFDLLFFNFIISRIRTVPGLNKRFKFPGWKRQIFGMFIGILTCAIISCFAVLVAGFFY